jgi:hypothetical protein
MFNTIQQKPKQLSKISVQHVSKSFSVFRGGKRISQQQASIIALTKLFIPLHDYDHVYPLLFNRQLFSQ